MSEHDLKQVIQGVYPGVTTIELDELAAQTSAYMSTQHPDFSKLAARISVSNLHKQTEKVGDERKRTYTIWIITAHDVEMVVHRNLDNSRSRSRSMQITT